MNFHRVFVFDSDGNAILTCHQIQRPAAILVFPERKNDFFFFRNFIKKLVEKWKKEHQSDVILHDKLYLY